eukprot:m.160575 g.160575  ORF g.160575 m.160575 type:complete len:563 (-) comp31186_c0_seq2:105-1793(-)
MLRPLTDWCVPDSMMSHLLFVFFFSLPFSFSFFEEKFATLGLHVIGVMSVLCDDVDSDCFQIDLAMLAGYAVMVVWTLLAFGSSILVNLEEKGLITSSASSGWINDHELLRMLSPVETAQPLHASHYMRCDLQELDGQPGANFPENALENEPYFVRNVSYLWGNVANNLTRDALLESFGQMEITVKDASSAVLAQFGHSPLRDILSPQKSPPINGENTKLSEFVHAMRQDSTTSMWFDVSGSQESLNLTSKFHRQPHFLHIHNKKGSEKPNVWRPVVSIGGAGSGLPFHVHGAAWLTTVYGSKLWFLIPPQNWPPVGEASKNFVLSPMQSSTARRLLKQPPSGLKVCLVSSGNAIVVPDGWAHATLNLGETIALGEQRAPDFSRSSSDPILMRSALEAAVYGEQTYRNGRDDDKAIAFLKRASELEPLNMKMAANLIAAQLGLRRYSEATSTANTAATLIMQLGKPHEVAYVLEAFALLFFEAAMSISTTEVPNSSLMDCARLSSNNVATITRAQYCGIVDNLVDFSLRTFNHVTALGVVIPPHVGLVHKVAIAYFSSAPMK